MSKQSDDGIRGIVSLPTEHRNTARRVALLAETGESELRISHTDHHNPDRYRLRLRHPDSCETDIGPRLPAEQFAAYLRGLADGMAGKVEKKANDGD